MIPLPKVESPAPPVGNLPEAPSRDTEPPSEPYGLFLWLIGIAIWLAWAPFEFRGNNSPNYAFHLQLDREFFGHLLMLIPVAVLLTVVAPVKGLLRPLWGPWVVASLIGLLLEIGQGWIALRSVSPDDVLAGSLGAAAAVFGTAELLRRGVPERTVLLGLIVVILFALPVSYLHAVAIPPESLTLAGWDPNFRIVAGDEFGVPRKYNGRVWDAKLCAGRPPDAFCVEPGADEAQRRQLVQEALRTQRIQVSAYVRSDSDVQQGPARIVTFSLGSVLRNVTLGQEHRALVFRLRTPWTGPNGASPEFILPNAVQEAIPTRVTASFEERTITITAENEYETVTGVFPPTTLNRVLQAGRREDQPGHPIFRNRGALVGASLFFSGLGLMIGWALRRCLWVAVLIAQVLGASGLWVLQDLLRLNMFSLGVAGLALSVIMPPLGVGMAAWDDSRWRKNSKSSTHSPQELG